MRELHTRQQRLTMFWCALPGCLAAAVFSAGSLSAAEPGYPIEPIAPNVVQLTDAFWAPRIETNTTVTIPLLILRCQETGRIENFVRAAAVLKQPDTTARKLPQNPFDDADVYKTIVAVSESLRSHPDAKLDVTLDDWIAKIAASQEPDGYLYTARTIDPAHPHALAGSERFANEKLESYELSNLGSLYAAALAHRSATGKKSLVDVAVRSADLLDSTFGPQKKSIWSGHEGIESMLARLSVLTGDKRYLNLAKFMLDERSTDAPAVPRGGRPRTNQSQQKPLSQTVATGNASDACKLYSGMADVSICASEPVYQKAVDVLWSDILDHKEYITGGIGSTGNDGTFGRNYVLPNANASCSTTASAAELGLNHRLFQLTGDARYFDNLERILFNSFLAAASEDGTKLFEVNPLESLGRQQRREWLSASRNLGGANAMPATPNSSLPAIAGMLAHLPSLTYAHNGDTIYVNLYASSTANVHLPNGGNNTPIKLEQQTKYPWDGKIKLTITPVPQNQPLKFPLLMRIPGWARGEAFSSDLYQFADHIDEAATLKINGQETPLNIKDGYARIEREWNAGDVVELNLPMPVRRVKANPQVADDRDRVALQRGPIVYCLEGDAGKNPKVRNLILPDDAALATKFDANLLGGLQVVTGKAQALTLDEHDEPVHTPTDFVAIPYFAWANRGPAEIGRLDSHHRCRRGADRHAEFGHQRKNYWFAKSGRAIGRSRCWQRQGWDRAAVVA